LVEYEFVVREVKEEKLPPLSDEFAKEFGFESMSELTEGIEKQIKKEKEREADDLAKTQIINSLIDTHPFEPPRSLVNAYLQPLIKEAKEMTEDTRKELEKIAIWYAKRDVLLKEIIKIEKIDISEEELKEKIEGLDKYKGLEYNRAVKKMKDEGEFDLFVGQLKRNKVLNFLLKHARRRDEEPVSANGD
jgi:trigger factor